MKFLAALLIMMIAAQPVQAGFCDMCASGGSASHAGMAHNDSHDGTANPADHDCCDPDQPGSGHGQPDQGCDNMAQCGFCTASTPAVPFALTLQPMAPAQQQFALPDGMALASHTSPPFRPPISIA